MLFCLIFIIDGIFFEVVEKFFKYKKVNCCEGVFWCYYKLKMYDGECRCLLL